MIWPTLDVETELLTTAPVVIGIDEVGRGAVAGPLVVGAAAWTREAVTWPQWLRDSKSLSLKRRVSVAEELSRSVDIGLGWIDADTIDRIGIVAALAQAAIRAIGDLARKGVRVEDAHILLDGSHDWLSEHLDQVLPMTVRAKADRDCVSVAAAACFAKVARDDYMAELAKQHPHYAWDSNRGYGTAAHMAAIAQHGPTGHHRQTWLR